MIKSISIWVLGLAATFPLAFRAAHIGHKPVDIIASDLLFLMLVLIPVPRLLRIPAGVRLPRLAGVRLLAGLFVLYSLGLALAAFAQTSEAARVVSAIKLVKPVLFLLLGTSIAATLSPVWCLKGIARGFALVTAATLGTAMTFPDFPRCAWGAYLFNTLIYGYPNSAMSYYGIMVPVLLALADTQSGRTWRWLYRGAAAAAGLIVISSVSRSSTIAMLFGCGLYLTLTGRVHIPVGVVLTGLFLALAGYGMSQFQFIMENPAVAHLTDLVQRRVEQTLEGGDPLSGRGNIWEETLALCAERPLLGYSFEAYSRYSFYDTPHQQYLEVLYKTGGLGLTLYGVMLIAMGLGLWHLARHAPRRSEVDFMIRGVLATLAAALLGNLSQPNLTYSVTGNCLFLMVGLLMNRFGATELTAFAPKPTSGSRTQPLPRPLPGRASSSAEPPGRKAA